ncbi:MAG: tetratricopeptide repeat protein, partial [Bryobacteraceae bacterium]
IDPTYARAYAGLADSYALMSNYFMAPATELMPKARSAALRALELDEGLAEAHTSLALIYESYDWNWKAAEREFRRAIELNPNYTTAHQWYGEFLAFRGRFQEAFAESARARQLDPLSLIIAADYGAMLYFARDYDRAIAQFRAVQAVDPDFPRARLVIFAYAQKGLFAEATTQLQNWRRSEPEGPWTWAAEVYLAERMGKQTEARQAMQRLEEVNRRHQMETTSILIGAYAAMGDKERALACLEKAYREHATAITQLKVDPVDDPLRSDPRFQDLLRRIGLHQ